MHENSEKMFILSEKRRKTKKSPRIIPFFARTSGLARGHHLRLGRYFGKEFQHPPMFSSNESVSEKF